MMSEQDRIITQIYYDVRFPDALRKSKSRRFFLEATAQEIQHPPKKTSKVKITNWP